MSGFIRNLTGGIRGMVNAAAATVNPYKVQVVTRDSLHGVPIVCRENCVILYKRPGCFECILNNPTACMKTFSLFRLVSEGESLTQFSMLATCLVVLVMSSSSVYREDILQSICDCVREHPTWTVAHVVSHIGLFESFKQTEISCEINTPCTETGLTPLMTAIMGSQVQCVQELLCAGASLEKTDQNGNTAYHWAVMSKPEIILVLAEVDRQKVVDFLNASGETAIMVACKMVLPDAVEALLLAGADPSVTACDLYPIHMATKMSSIKCIKLLCEKHPEQMFSKDKHHGGVPLHWARTKEVVETLCRQGSDVNIKSSTGHTPLNVMMMMKRTECVMEILCFGADSRIGDEDGNTSLHWAVEKDDVELARTFVVFGADVNLRNNRNQTPRHLAATSKAKNKDIILYILHVSGAKRCGHDVKGCLAGCYAEGTANGTPECKIQSMLDTDREAILDDILSAAVSCTATITHNQSEPVLEMADGPIEVGDRVLCLDGGGIRGLILIQILMAIERAVGKPINECFDWISGTSTGGLLALGIAVGRPLQLIKGLYYRMKDEVFKGRRPYSAEPFEEMLKREFGETKVMTDIKHPKVIVTGVMADRHPAELHMFRNFTPTIHKKQPITDNDSNTFQSPLPPEAQPLWHAARCSGAAPSYFRSFERFVDGGLISNNPTLDLLTEIHEYNTGLKLRSQGHLVRPLGCVVSLGTGRIPVTHVNHLDIYRPEGIMDAHKVFQGMSALTNLLVDQATLSEGRPVDRARAWCSMINVPFFRFSPRLSEDVPLDCHDNKTLINMMWETECYIVANKNRIEQLAALLGLHNKP
ncbi:hypothetical protein ScPMuIL_003927 [Solemya velum]